MYYQKNFRGPKNLIPAARARFLTVGLTKKFSLDRTVERSYHPWVIWRNSPSRKRCYWAEQSLQKNRLLGGTVPLKKGRGYWEEQSLKTKEEVIGWNSPTKKRLLGGTVPQKKEVIGRNSPAKKKKLGKRLLGGTVPPKKRL